MYRNTRVDQAYHLLIEGKTPAEVRADINIELTEWNDMLHSDKFRKMFRAGVSSPLGLIQEIEIELFEALRLRDANPLHWKQKEDLNQKINNLSVRYSTFLIPKPPK